MEQFHTEHPDWPLQGGPLRAPKIQVEPGAVYQAGMEGQKLQYLVDKGFEIANHTTSHNRMETEWTPIESPGNWPNANGM